MTPSDAIPPDVRERILAAVEEGKVTAHEADAYLRHEYGESLSAPQQPSATSMAQHPVARNGAKIAILILVFAVVALVAALFLQSGIPAGMLVLDQPVASAENTTPIPVQITSLRVAGVLYGEGNASIYFDTQNETLLVASVMSDDGAPQTENASYAPGEQVIVRNAPTNASYYLDTNGSSEPVEAPFTAPTENSTLRIIANESGTLRMYRLPIIIGDARRETAFEDACIETCAMNLTNGTLRIVGDVRLTRVEAQEENRAPVLAAQLVPLTVENATSLNLSSHFIDPDGEALMYTTGASDIAQLRVNGSLLEIAPMRSGTENVTIYASDLHELVQATLEITVVLPRNGAPTANVSAPEDNITGSITTTTNDTLPAQELPVVNETIGNETNTNSTGLNQTSTTAVNMTENATAGCDNPDVNQRPNYCLLNSSKLLEEDLFWEDVERRPVARITELGNLMLTGTVIENDVTGRPAQDEFSIGYTDADFNYIPTIWVSGGDLHLRGRLHEETAEFVPPQGSYIASNRRGVNLAYANRNAGDLYLRGNVIPYRRTIQVNG